MKSPAHSLVTLRIFTASAHHLSFSRAAEAVHLTQSAVSKHVKALEERLGVELFVRHARGLSLTEAGRIYLDEIAPALEQVDRAAARIQALRADENRFALGVPPAIADWLTPRLAAFLDRHPALTVTIRPRQASGAQGGAARSVAPDAEIRFGDGRWPGARARYLIGREVSLVASPALLARRRLREPLDLARPGAPALLRHVLVPHAWAEWSAAVGLERDALDVAEAPEYEQYSVLLPAVLAGLGVAVAPRFLVATPLEAGTLVAPFGEIATSRFGYHYVVPDRLRHSRPVRLLGEHLAREARRGANA